MDGRLLTSAQERVSLATKIVTAEDEQNKVTRQNQWFRDTAEEAGIELDDNCLIDDIFVTNKSNNNNKAIGAAFLHNAETAKARLKVLLSQPMQTQRYGKFLSTNSSLVQEVTNQFVVANNEATTTTTKKTSKSNRKRKRNK